MNFFIGLSVFIWLYMLFRLRNHEARMKHILEGDVKDLYARIAQLGQFVGRVNEAVERLSKFGRL